MWGSGCCISYEDNNHGDFLTAVWTEDMTSDKRRNVRRTVGHGQSDMLADNLCFDPVNGVMWQSYALWWKNKDERAHGDRRLNTR